ncbi:MAG: hypothetical protein DRJ42_10555 [Deltaproteobacteria bacterium]|nr:MAG: hypothetical protein DRJ42_10555 [Deltaproteobacteria bacterium]
MSNAPDDLTGQTLLGKFRVLRCIGAGGMGAVYEVEHLLTGHRRALKVLHRRLAHSAESVARFVREAGIAGRLRSPYLPETYDVGRLESGATYMLMELLHGGTLYDLLEQHGRLPSERVVDIARQVCEGLATAHDGGILHRDLKPDNIFVATGLAGGDQVKILDFGIATYLSGGSDRFGSLTQTGAMIGTPRYMAPEQAAAQAPDVRSDLYSLGVILYEALGGVRAFDGPTPVAVIGSIARGDFVPLSQHAPDVNAGLEELVHRAMARDPAARFSTASEMRDALLAVAAASRTDPHAAPASPKEPQVGAAGPSLARWGCLGAAALLLTAVGVGGGLYLWSASQAPPPAPTVAVAPPAPMVPTEAALDRSAPVAVPRPGLVADEALPDQRGREGTTIPATEPAPRVVPRAELAVAPEPPGAVRDPSSPPTPPSDDTPPAATGADTRARSLREDALWSQTAYQHPRRCVREARDASGNEIRTLIGFSCATGIPDVDEADHFCKVLMARHPSTPLSQSCAGIVDRMRILAERASP